jgi:hypothetical protein
MLPAPNRYSTLTTRTAVYRSSGGELTLLFALERGEVDFVRRPWLAASDLLFEAADLRIEPLDALQLLTHELEQHGRHAALAISAHVLHDLLQAGSQFAPKMDAEFEQRAAQLVDQHGAHLHAQPTYGVQAKHALLRLVLGGHEGHTRLLCRGPDSLGIGDAWRRQNRACRTIRDIPGIGMLIRVEAHLRHRVTINRAVRQRDTPIQSTLRVNPAKD